MLKQMVKEDYEEIFFAEVIEVIQEGKFLTIQSNLNKDSIIRGVKSISSFDDDGLDFVPSVGSKCIVFRYAKNYLATAFSKLEFIHLGGKDNEGIVKVKELTDRINDLEKALNSLKTSYNAHTHAVPSLGTSAVAVPVNTAIVPTSTVADFENIKVKH